MTIQLIPSEDRIYLYAKEIQTLEHETVIIEPPDEGVVAHSHSKEELHTYLSEYAQLKIKELLQSLKNKPSKFRYRPPMAI